MLCYDVTELQLQHGDMEMGGRQTDRCFTERTNCVLMLLCFSYNMATGGIEDRSLFKKFQFHYAVFDEGHLLKNMSTLRFQNLMKISVSVISGSELW